MSENFIKKQRIILKYNLKKLQVALDHNKKLTKKIFRQNLSVPKKKVNLQNFFDRLKYEEKQKKKKQKEYEQELKQNKKKRIPEISEKSKELTKYQPSFNKRINKMFINQKEANEKKKKLKEKKILEKSSKSLKIKKKKKFSDDDTIKAGLFFQRTQNWKKKKLDNDFYKKIVFEQNRLKEDKIPDYFFKPKINKSKNKEMVKKAFFERNQDFLLKKSKSISKIEKDTYFYDYKPKFFRKLKKKKFSNKSLI